MHVLAPVPAFSDISPTPRWTDLDVIPRDTLSLATIQVRSERYSELARRTLGRFGLTLPDSPRRSSAGAMAIVGLAPNRWLAMQDGAEHDLAASLAYEFSDLATVADHTGGYGVLRLVGRATVATLSRLVPLDLHPGSFAIGDAANTEAAHINVSLWRIDNGPDGHPAFEIACPRSFAVSFWHCLSEAAASATGTR